MEGAESPGSGDLVGPGVDAVGHVHGEGTREHGEAAQELLLVGRRAARSSTAGWPPTFVAGRSRAVISSTRSRKRSARRSRSCASGRCSACFAASSMASGSRSRRSQISSMIGQSRSSASRAPPSVARSTNSAAASRSVSGLSRNDRLAGYAQRLPGRRQDPQIGTSIEQVVDERPRQARGGARSCRRRATWLGRRVRRRARRCGSVPPPPDRSMASATLTATSARVR